MRRSVRTLFEDQRGAIAPTVALALVGLIAVGGLAFDYARLGTMDTELQQAADQAALAAATQLDGKSGAMDRAKAAANSLVVNRTSFANDGGGATVGGLTLTYYASYDQSADDYGAVATTDATAKVVKVEVGGRTAKYALTPIIGLITGQTVVAQAVASIGNAICKTPPVMLCNPAEPSNNTDENLAFSGTKGNGLRLITGNATVPGNFGWLDSGLGNGANALAAALGYNSPPGDCLPETGVTTKTGMNTSVLNAFNTRFDIYANGNTTCPGQLGGTCSPPLNTRKDLVCNSNTTGCTGNSSSWTEASKPYRLPTITVCDKYNAAGKCTQSHQVSSEAALPADKSQDPTIMGFPHDICQAGLGGTLSCPNSLGNGIWDRDAYFRVNYGYLTATAWQSGTGLSPTVTRFEVYQWELAHPSVTVAGSAKGMSIPQGDTGNNRAFSYPSTGNAGVGASTSQPDRRRISVAVLNCQALSVHGKTVNAPVTTWLDVFLTEPNWGRSGYSDPKEIYTEIIGITTNSTGGSGQVVRRDKPFLIR